MKSTTKDESIDTKHDKSTTIFKTLKKIKQFKKKILKVDKQFYLTKNNLLTEVIERKHHLGYMSRHIPFIQSILER